MSALGNKGEKNQGKFKAIDINNLFKGSSVTPQKPAPVSSRQHGLQSLGKVVNIRRMPPPANLPSLRSENSGSDSNLGPPSSAGWTKEDTPPESPVAAPAAAAVAQPKPPQTTQPLPTSTSQLHEHQSQQIHSQNQSNPPSANANLWSSVTSGGRRPGTFLDQKSAIFRDEFPQLALGSEEKIQTGRKEDGSREPQPGPGLNLRPQNVGNWREGGGHATERLSPSVPPLAGESGGGVVAGEDVSAGEIPRPASVGHAPMGFRGPMPSMMPMRPGPGMPPQPLMAPAAFRGMPMMPFGFRPGFPPNYPPNFIPPGMQRPPFMNPADFRFQGMYPGQQHWNFVRFPGSEEPSSSGADRPLIVKDKDIEGFDHLHISDVGWAGATVDVDYSEKIIFSDEEDDLPAAADKSQKIPVERQSSEGSGRSSDRDRARSEHDLSHRSHRDSDSRISDRESGPRVARSDSDSRSDRDVGPRSHRDSETQDSSRFDKVAGYDRQTSSEANRSPLTPKEAWLPVGPMGPFTRLPAPPPPNQDRRQWRPEMPQFDIHGPPLFQQPPFIQRPPYRAPLEVPCSSSSNVSLGGSLETDDEEVWRQRRKQQSDNMTAAIERARQRREEEERRMKEEQTAAAREKLRQLDEKLGKKDDKEAVGDRERSGSGKDGAKINDGSDKSTAVGNVRPPQRLPKADQDPSMPPQSSDSDRNDVPGSGGVPSASGSSSPRPQLQQQQQQRPTDRPAGYWPYDPRAWGPMSGPPRYMMDPRYLWHMQHGGMPVIMPPRRPPSNESAAEGHVEKSDSVDSSAGRPPWLDQSHQNAYGLHPGMPGGQYEQHMAQAVRQYYGIMPAEYSQKDYEQYEQHGYAGGSTSGYADDVSSRSHSQPTSARSCSLSDDEGPRVAASDPSPRNESDQATSGPVSMDPLPKSVVGAPCRSANASSHSDQSSRQESYDRKQWKESDANEQRSSDVRTGYRATERHTAPNADESGNNAALAPLKRNHSGRTGASNASSVAASEHRTDSTRDSVQPTDRPNTTRSSGQLSQKSASKESLKPNQSSKVKNTPSNQSLREEEFNNKLEIGSSDAPVSRTQPERQSDVTPDKTNDAAAGNFTTAAADSKLNGSVDLPPAKRKRDGGRPYRRRKDEQGDPERVRVATGSREFVRGGRGRLRSGRARNYSGDYGRFAERSGHGGGFKNADDDYDYESEAGSTNHNARPTGNKAPDVSGLAAGRQPAEHRSDPSHSSALPPSSSASTRRDVREPSSEALLSSRNAEAQSGRRQDGNRRNFGGPRNDWPQGQKFDFQQGPRNEMHGFPSDNGGGRGSRGPRYSGNRARGGGSGNGAGNSGGATGATGGLQTGPKQPPADNKNSSHQSETGRNAGENVNNPASVVPSAESAASSTGGEKSSSVRPPGSHRNRGSKHRQRRGAAPTPGPAADATNNNSNTGCLTEPTDVKDHRPDNRSERPAAAGSNFRGFSDDARYDERPRQDGNYGGRGPPRENNSRHRRREPAARKPPQPLLLPPADPVTAGQGSNAAAAHEEWETASESSDVLRNNSQPQPRKDRDRPAVTTSEKRDVKKSFSNQRAAFGRRAQKNNDRRPAVGESSAPESAVGQSRIVGAQTNGGAAMQTAAAGSTSTTRIEANAGASSSGANGAARVVYRLDQVVYDNPAAIRYALARSSGKNWQEKRTHPFTSISGRTIDRSDQTSEMVEQASLCGRRERHDSGIVLCDEDFSLPVDQLVDHLLSDEDQAATAGSCYCGSTDESPKDVNENDDNCT